jgi:hypothetical protein
MTLNQPMPRAMAGKSKFCRYQNDEGIATLMPRVPSAARSSARKMGWLAKWAATPPRSSAPGYSQSRSKPYVARFCNSRAVILLLLLLRVLFPPLSRSQEPLFRNPFYVKYVMDGAKALLLPS